MRRFLFTTLASNDLGLLTRSLPIARELAKRGHRVAFCNPAEAPSKLIAEAGFENLLAKHPLYYLNYLKTKGDLTLKGLYRAIRSGQLKQDYEGLFGFLRQLVRCLPTALPTTSEVWSVDHLAAIGGMLGENFVRAECEALLALMTDYEADVIVDFFNAPACIAARAVGKPLVTVIQADMHPDSRGFIWWREPPPDLPTPTPTLNKILADYRLPPICKTEELFVGDLTLVLGMPETDPLPAKAQVTYIGPILWQKAEAELPDWFDKSSTEKPVIWVYSGNPRYLPVRTPVDSVVVLHACIAALANAEAQVVLTTGHHALPKDVLPLPANFRYAPYVPGLAMAQQSDLLIHHGGYGSCQLGLYTGTPAVIIPTYSERESNARRVAAVGAGEFVLPTQGAWGKKSVRVEELRAKVKQVLSDPGYAASTKRIAEKMRTYGGAAEAARLIEDLSNSTELQREEAARG
ncbi:MAG TPA: nucleotide disphospho-sugar-binding domain-containing protein [Anaerolineae bacterium]|nr:nucleotide disphospho-sugar-binding domain-containing protein [Anaerolineae bacterium]